MTIIPFTGELDPAPKIVPFTGELDGPENKAETISAFPQGDPMGTGFAEMTAQPTQTRTGSVFDDRAMDPPTNDAALNQQAMEKANPQAAASVMYSTGRAKQQADAMAAKGAHLEDKAAAERNQTSGSTAQDVALNLLGGAASTTAKAGAALSQAVGANEPERSLDASADYWRQVQKENGGGSITGRVAGLVGGVTPAVLSAAVVPASAAWELASTAGLFAIPAFRDTLKDKLEQGQDFPLALAHASQAYGINMFLPQAMSKGLGVVATKGAAGNLAAGAVEGAGFSAANSALDKGTDLAFGQKNDKDWIDFEDMAVNAIGFPIMRAATMAGKAATQGVEAVKDRMGTPSEQFGRALGQDVDTAQFQPASLGVTTNPNLARAAPNINAAKPAVSDILAAPSVDEAIAAANRLMASGDSVRDQMSAIRPLDVPKEADVSAVDGVRPDAGRPGVDGLVDASAGVGDRTGLDSEPAARVSAEPVAADRASESVPPVAADAVATFTTAKGSTYVVHADGSTSRDKAFHPEHGAADQGPQPRSERTFYIRPEDAERLGEIQSINGGARRIVVEGDQAAIKYDDGPSAGKIERRTVTDILSAPAEGLIPVELWKGGARVHFGNEITKMGQSAEAEKPAQVSVNDSHSQPESSPMPDLTPNEKKALEGNPLRLFLMWNGVSMKLAKEFVPGARERLSMGRTFRKGGLEMDALAQRAAEQGFIKDASDTDALYDLITRSVSGERIGAMYGEDADLELRGRAERQRQREQDDHEEEVARAMANSAHDFDLTPEELHEIGYTQETSGVQERVRELVARAEANGLDSDTIIEDAHYATKGGTDEHFLAAARNAVEAAIARRRDEGAGDRRADPRQESEAPAVREEPSLARPSADDVIAQQERRTAGDKAEAKRRADEQAKAKADAELPDFTLQGSDRKADANPDQAPMFRAGGELPFTREEAASLIDRITALPKRGITQDEFHSEVAKHFGEKVAQRLAQSGVVVPLKDQSSLPAHVVPFVRDGNTVYGFHDPRTNRTYVVLKNLTPAMVKGLVLHEVGVHYGFRAMLGAAKYDQVLARVAVMGKAGNREIKAALDRAQRNSVNAGQVREETLAYLVQNHSNIGVVREIIARIRAFLYNKFGIGGKSLSVDDITALARAAVLHSSRTQPGDRAPDFARDTQLSTDNPKAAPRFSRGDKPTEPFYSALSREVEGINAKAQGADGWRAQIQGLVSKGRIKADEVEWTGLNDWLKMQSGKVTKEQITEFLKGNGVQVKEVTRGGMDEESQRNVDFHKQNARFASDKLNAAVQEATDLIHKKFGQVKAANASLTFTQVRPGHDPEGRLSEAYDLLKKSAPENYDFNKINDAQDEFDSAVRHRDETVAVARPATKYGDYTLPNGENYREVLLTLPEAGHKVSAEYDAARRGHTDAMAAYKGAVEEHGNLQHPQVVSAQEAMNAQRARLDAVGKKIDALPLSYRSAHWEESNILAHIRLNDRTDADGKRVLFVEELQSDWAQEGRKKGFASDEIPKPTDDEVRAYYDLKPEANPADYRDELLATLQKRARARGVPDAPFVGKTDAWLSLALKRIVKMAADEGYDKVAFVNGDQSAARYDLSKHIDQVVYFKNADGTFDVQIAKDGHVIKTERKASTDQISDLIGKDLAEKIASGEGKPEGEGKSLSGLDLKVGGEGMKTFYDKIVPTVAKDVVRKLGGDGLTSMDMEQRNAKSNPYFGNEPFDPADARVLERTRGVFQVWVKNANGVEQLRGNGNFDSREAADAFIKTGGRGEVTKQTAFDITPAMREKVADGVPMFSRDEAAEGADLPNEVQTRPPYDGPGESPRALRAKLAKVLRVPVEVIADPLRKLSAVISPMSSGAENARAQAKTAINQMRAVDVQWLKLDAFLKSNFSVAEQERMWAAGDEENDIRRARRLGETPDVEGRGLDSLNPAQRAAMDALHGYSEGLRRQAVADGLLEGEGVDFWTPRVAAKILENGDIAQPFDGMKGGGKNEARNLRTTAGSLKHREYETTAESEAALKAKHGDDAEYVKNIRVMPLMMAQMEKALIGRRLVNQIKARGQALGDEVIRDSDAPGYRIIDHPSLRTWSPKMDWKAVDRADLEARGYTVEDGKVLNPKGRALSSYRIRGDSVEQFSPVMDEHGNPILESRPMHIREDWYGPLKSIFTGPLLGNENVDSLYRTLMEVKSTAMTTIMFSPLTHFQVIYGRALPGLLASMGGKASLKNAGTLGAYSYVLGYKLRTGADADSMAQYRYFVEHGMVPVSGRGLNQDIAGIVTNVQPGRSLVAKAVGAAFDTVGYGDGARRAIDTAGHFWHETLLWDRIADLQAGVAMQMSSNLMDKGFSRADAATIAGHFANRYAGMIPREAMSQGANALANLLLFSKSFTLGNIGAMKDIIAGLPRDMQAQIRVRAMEASLADKASPEQAAADGDKALSRANSITRKKAAASFALDVGAMYLATSIVQSVFATIFDKKTWADVLEGYRERYGDMIDHIKAHPTEILTSPLGTLHRLTPGADNPKGKEDRVRVGSDEAGNTYYMRLPFGKVPEEFMKYAKPLSEEAMALYKAKTSTLIKPWMEIGANEDFQGRQIINPQSNQIIQLGQAVGHFLKSQFPVDVVKNAARVATGDATLVEKAKLAGDLTGYSVSQLRGGDEVAEIGRFNREQHQKLRNVMPEVRDLALHGKTEEAQDLLEKEAGLLPKESQRILAQIENPSRISAAKRKNFNKHSDDEQQRRLETLGR